MTKIDTEFTPKTTSIRIAYAYIMGGSREIYRAREAAFDRWLTAYAAEVIANYEAEKKED